MAPVVDRVAEKFRDRALVAKVNAARYREIAARFGVDAVPAFVLLRDGETVKKSVGPRSEETLTRLLEEALAESAAGESAGEDTKSSGN
jgi:thioredoxin 1